MGALPIGGSMARLARSPGIILDRSLECCLINAAAAAPEDGAAAEIWREQLMANTTTASRLEGILGVVNWKGM